MIEFITIPILTGVLIAATVGPLGAFVVWRKMAYFGDTLAHSSLLGLSLGFIFQINLNITLIVSCLLISILLVGLQRKSSVSIDTLLGIIAHTSLSLGLISISLVDDLRVDLMAYLFGDLLSVSSTDLFWIAGYCGLVTITLIKLWRPLLAITVNEDLARVDGYDVHRLRLILMLMVGLVIAIAMKFIGALIITSLMIIPAATARRFSSSPEQMALLASVIGIISVIAGIALSWFKDTPAGPSIVVIAGLLFLMSQFRSQVE
ncbi:zinc ABC transporter permease subunit ZnuB [Candidatus Enterovibrio escicola]|uniref:High-affinity zinc uptake system membrane protein ZnuB n=1 Tax=Candidatus Enterovibrio escicola TaxID=1927127 RepID=A0A2A5T3R0_9GAMM|nr:zinc ABC transporter permease subunit ZnuB [Candidatus Enterovibrio escacola]PCS22803.1 Zinc ABC transporter, inner membrane permease protein ZnuB [Candidatus Enterovibrio escacola]